MKATSQTINRLFAQEDWVTAERLIRADLKSSPTNHWLLTQLGVTLYERKQYEMALKQFEASLEETPDCPLTLWNVAGALDAVGSHNKAIRIYMDLIRSNKRAQDDPCWESKKWSDSLKSDCLFRIGVCFRKFQKKHAAEAAVMSYLKVFSIGYPGIYSMVDVEQELKKIQSIGQHSSSKNEVRLAFESAVRAAGSEASIPETTNPLEELQALLQSSEGHTRKAPRRQAARKRKTRSQLAQTKLTKKGGILTNQLTTLS